MTWSHVTTTSTWQTWMTRNTCQVSLMEVVKQWRDTKRLFWMSGTSKSRFWSLLSSGRGTPKLTLYIIFVRHSPSDFHSLRSTWRTWERILWKNWLLPWVAFHYLAVLTMRRYTKHDHHNSKHHQIISSANPFASATHLAISNLKHPKRTHPHSIQNCGTFALTLLIGTRNRLLSGSSSNFFRASFRGYSNGICTHVLFVSDSNLIFALFEVWLRWIPGGFMGAETKPAASLSFINTSWSKNLFWRLQYPAFKHFELLIQQFSERNPISSNLRLAKSSQSTVSPTFSACASCVSPLLLLSWILIWCVVQGTLRVLWD